MRRSRENVTTAAGAALAARRTTPGSSRTGDPPIGPPSAGADTTDELTAVTPTPGWAVLVAVGSDRTYRTTCPVAAPIGGMAGPVIEYTP
ncbi:hypothetical protein ACFY8O_15930 [Streptomyces argenteolus]|uniref:Uncharacterized protein n=1 Tax=Streptomyces argenteolus TaxID=67274 RepID=A0ABW6X8N4_9ACTN